MQAVSRPTTVVGWRQCQQARLTGIDLQARVYDCLSTSVFHLHGRAIVRECECEEAATEEGGCKARLAVQAGPSLGFHLVASIGLGCGFCAVHLLPRAPNTSYPCDTSKWPRHGGEGQGSTP